MSAVTVTILKGSTKLAPSFQVISLETFRSVNKVPAAQIVLMDGDPALQKSVLSDSDFFDPGNEIEIRLRYETEASKDISVFKGMVVHQVASADQDGFLLTVELRHEAFYLTTTRKNAIFRDKDDNDIVKTLLKENGFKVSGTLGDKLYKHRQLVQYSCTDWDFALSRADTNGCSLIVKDDEMMLQPLKEAAKKTASVTLGIDEIYGFELQAAAPAVRKGDEKKASEPQTTPEESSAWSGARTEKSKKALLRGRIRLKGRTDIAPGDAIGIKGAGKRFSDNVLVSGISHKVDQDGWITDIQLGLSDGRFSEQTNIAETPAFGLLPAVHGLQIGIVDNFEEDPDKTFRVKVKVPGFFHAGKDGVVWARLGSAYAGATTAGDNAATDRGVFFCPEPGDEVIVGFFNDDPRQAVILGSLYSTAIPKDFAADKKNADKGIVMKNGARLRFRDDKDKSVIELMTPAKSMITIDDDKKSIVITDQHKNSIEMNKSGITIKSAKDLTMEASGNVTIKGSEVAIKGSKVDIK